MLAISLDTASNSPDIPTAAYKRVKNRVTKAYPTLGLSKWRTSLRTGENLTGDLPTAVRHIRTLVLEALGKDAEFVMVSVHATRGTRARAYDLGTVGTPDVITENYHLG